MVVESADQAAIYTLCHRGGSAAFPCYATTVQWVQSFILQVFSSQVRILSRAACCRNKALHVLVFSEAQC